jgi:hypothetical protein
LKEKRMEEKLSSVLAFIKAYRAHNGFSPSRREIGKKFPAANGKPSSNAVVDYWLLRLKMAGKVNWIPGIGRSLIPTDESPKKGKGPS